LAKHFIYRDTIDNVFHYKTNMNIFEK